MGAICSQNKIFATKGADIFPLQGKMQVALTCSFGLLFKRLQYWRFKASSLKAAEFSAAKSMIFKDGNFNLLC
jgi:hypothetical protein